VLAEALSIINLHRDNNTLWLDVKRSDLVTEDEDGSSPLWVYQVETVRKALALIGEGEKEQGR